MGERFFNGQSDMDWTWGPFLSLRPPRNQPLRPWVWVRLFLIFTLLGLMLLGLLGILCLLLPPLAAAQGWRVSPGMAEALATLRAMGSDTQTRALLVGLALALPPLFFAFCLPYHWAWNRRAARLGSAGDTRQEPVPENVPGTWPPSPRV